MKKILHDEEKQGADGKEQQEDVFGKKNGEKKPFPFFAAKCPLKEMLKEKKMGMFIKFFFCLETPQFM
jgi:hypothetical protein